MKDQQQVAERLIQLLGALRNRPLMYLGTDDPVVISAFLQGAAHAVWTCGYPIPLTFGGRYGLAYSERGWNQDKDVIEQMRVKGMDNTTILSELIDIEIEVIRRTMDASHS